MTAMDATAISTVVNATATSTVVNATPISTVVNATTSFTTVSDNSDNCTSSIIELENDDASLERLVFLSIFLSLMSIIIIVGNIFVLLAVTRLPKPRRPTRYLVINLAVADLGLGIFILPFSSYNEIVLWPFGEKWCVVHAVGDSLLCISSLYTLCALAVDRFIGVTRPLRYNVIMTDRMVVAMVIVVWLIAWCVSCPPLFGWRQPPSADGTCGISTHVYYVIESCAFGFFLPSIIVMCLYTKIYLVARKHIFDISKNMIPSNIDIDVDSGCGSSFSSSISGSSQDVHISMVTSNCPNQALLLKKIAKIRMEVRAAKTFGKVLGIFVICWMPFILVYPFGSLCSSCVIPELAWDIVFWLGYANSMMNPFVYAMSSPEYRTAFGRLLWCRARNDSQVDVLTSVPRRAPLNVSNDKF
ncbi:probable G-protein coupled receptor No9 [Ylistrum balloti]|uniref:probable G-protein coupled receptor No9 n=1 Tax=Ylistrum balloti TaxID=509963 RepID=UPI00290590FF|nr:probable G-protein coupled receptor No9 [Ylistrum balloti]